MYTQEQILDMYFDRNQQAVSATSQMYGAKLTRFADTMVAHEDALECVNDTYIAAWNKIPPERHSSLSAVWNWSDVICVPCH